MNNDATTTCTATKPFYATTIVITAEQSAEWQCPRQIDLTGKLAFVTSAGVYVPNVLKTGLYMAAGKHTARRILAEVYPELRDGSEQDSCPVPAE